MDIQPCVDFTLSLEPTNTDNFQCSPTSFEIGVILLLALCSCYLSFFQKPHISLPPQALELAGTKNVRLEFVSFANDKFFRSQHGSGLPVIAAKITNTEVSNLSHPVLYHIPLAASHTSDLVHPVCVFWDEKGIVEAHISVHNIMHSTILLI